MPLISVVIAHMPTPELDEMLDNCLKSIKGQYSELVLVINEGIGYGKSFNKGFKHATGDYLIAVSNDTTLTAGRIRDLLDPKAVTYSYNSQFGCFFCLPRWVYRQVGGFDEGFEMAYHEDSDYLRRLKEAGIPVKRVPSVEVWHKGGATVKALGINEGELQKKNKEVLDRKWNSI